MKYAFSFFLPLLLYLFIVFFTSAEHRFLSVAVLFVVGSRRAGWGKEMEQLKNEKMAQDGGDVSL